MTTQEILRQANLLKEYSQSNEVRYVMPRDIWHSYQSAYKERVRYAALYANDDRVQLANEGHEYFNGVIDRVQKQLRDCVDVVAVSRPVEEAIIETNTEGLASVFERRRVDDPKYDSDSDSDNLQCFPDRQPEALTEEQSDFELVLSPTYERSMRTYCLRHEIKEQAFEHLKTLWVGTYIYLPRKWRRTREHGCCFFPY